MTEEENEPSELEMIAKAIQKAREAFDKSRDCRDHKDAE
jgi:hypothetical protein